MPGALYDLRKTISGHTVRIFLAGEFDLGARATLQHAVSDAVQARSVQEVEVDLGAVTFLDCSTIGVLVAGHHAARRRGATLRVTHARGLPLRILRLTGLDGLLAGAPDSGLGVGALATANGTAPARPGL